MNHNVPPSDPLASRANALYWESGQSVNQIADEMDISKGMLYGLIDPLPSELPCPRCSTTLEYANRTARERGLLNCSECGFEGDQDEAREQWEEADPSGSGPALVIAPHTDPGDPEGAAGARPMLLRTDPLLLGAGLLLVAAGLWLFRGLGRRS